MTPQNDTDELNQARIVEPSTPLRPIAPEPQFEPPTQATPPPSYAPKKRPLLPIMIVLGVLTLLGGSTAAAYTLWYQHPDRVMANAMSNLLQSENVQQTTTISPDTAIPLVFLPMSFKGVALESATDVSQNNSMKLAIDMDLTGQLSTVDQSITTGDDKKLRLAAEAVAMKNGELYFKLNDVKASYMKFLGAMGAQDVTLSSRANELIAEVDNTWVKTDTKDMGEINSQFGCALDELNGSNKDVVNAVTEVYVENRFVIVEEKLTPKSGNLGYRVTIDQAKANQFYTALRDKEALKNLNECLGNTTADGVANQLEQSQDEGDNPTFDIWISRWDHQLKAVSFETGSSDDKSSQALQLKGNTEITYDKGVKVSAPSDARSLKDWQASLAELNTVLNAQLQVNQSTVSTQGVSVFNQV